MPSEAPVLVSREDGVATLILNRPAAGNAMDLALLRALRAAASEAATDPEVRCVVVTGQGRFFCVGGDVPSFSQAGDEAPALVHALASTLHEAMLLLTGMDKPLVTAVNGTTAGGGVGLAMIGDVALAARTAQFSLAYSAIGLTPDGGASWLLPRLVGLRRAQELALTGRRIDGEEAAAIGLVTRAVDDEALVTEAKAVARDLARGPIVALSRTRRLLLRSFETSLADHMATEARTIAESMAGEEGQEGVAAFLEKRRPDFG